MSVIRQAILYPVSLPERRTLGTFPVRQEITVLPADEPNRLRRGWVIHEEIGITIINPSAISRVSVALSNPPFLMSDLMRINDAEEMMWTDVKDGHILISGFMV